MRHLDVLKYLHEKGCPCDEWTCEGAAKGGHLDVLEYLHENGCPLNERCCKGAAKGGHLVTLQWLRSEGCPWAAGTWRVAANSTREWLIENDCPTRDLDN